MHELWTTGTVSQCRNVQSSAARPQETKEAGEKRHAVGLGMRYNFFPHVCFLGDSFLFGRVIYIADRRNTKRN